MSLTQTLASLTADNKAHLLSQLNRGLERETLRIDADAKLAQSPHPVALGSALTHDCITTDYSESLLEFITGVETDIETLLGKLQDTQKYTLENINSERLWPISMPCDIGAEVNIPIAQYGSSNIGKMKTLYRKGLTHRYGAKMQVIAGLHFNFSVSTELMQYLHENTKSQKNLQDFQSEAYFALIRNYLAKVWFLPYLFGASPVLCNSFLDNNPTQVPLEPFTAGSSYLPFGTSLRMSDLGYTNKEQNALGISYNSLQQYVDSVIKAIVQPSAAFAGIGVKVEGEYRQLNDRILQIENELYSSIRPKKVAQTGETPSHALKRGGVEYIEVRALDINPFSPLGITADQIRILDLFLLHCLLSPAKLLDTEQQQRNAENLSKVILNGRQPDLELDRAGNIVTLRSWLRDIFAAMTEIAEAMGPQKQEYLNALEQWRPCIEDPSATLSAQVISAVKQAQEHSIWASKLADDYQQQLLDGQYQYLDENYFREMAELSVSKQALLEQQDSLSFDEYLDDYFSYLKS
ncbi:glutamate--cysteine ligase [Paraferrimonas sp. SM1919]|uniref:glutamate--cysteine ligase n=1 Tax=Paraferrimonas sp. SM1919 TaxID=2662263 RepID=UPI0013D2C1BF|nr:glutamate--cysteine ligase [Paraferrimonas sp. SM1919]